MSVDSEIVVVIVLYVAGFGCICAALARAVKGRR